MAHNADNLKPFMMDIIPDGWEPIKGALTAPVGWKWYSNGKSLWDKDYRKGLIREERVAKGGLQECAGGKQKGKPGADRRVGQNNGRHEKQAKG